MPAVMLPTNPGMAQCLPLSVGLMPRHGWPDGPVRMPWAVRSSRLNLRPVSGSTLLYHCSIVSGGSGCGTRFHV